MRLPEGAEPIDLDAVARWSPWPARLLGLDGGEREPRTPDSVMREYDLDKYGHLLTLLGRDPGLGFDDLKGIEVGTASVVTSVGDQLVVAQARAAADLAREVVLDALEDELQEDDTVLDLGCGYGYHLHHLGRRRPGLHLRGGEPSPNARQLARLLGADVRPFDVMRPSAEIADGLGGPVTVLMSMVLHQLPTAALAVEALLPLRARIARVVVFDAVEEVQPEGLLGLMRHRYMQLNHYSWDLLAVLGARNDVEVLDVRPNAVGPNFLLPGSIVSWRFL